MANNVFDIDADESDDGIKMASIPKSWFEDDNNPDWFAPVISYGVTEGGILVPKRVTDDGQQEVKQTGSIVSKHDISFSDAIAEGETATLLSDYTIEDTVQEIYLYGRETYKTDSTVDDLDFLFEWDGLYKEELSSENNKVNWLKDNITFTISDNESCRNLGSSLTIEVTNNSTSQLKLTDLVLAKIEPKGVS